MAIALRMICASIGLVALILTVSCRSRDGPYEFTPTDLSYFEFVNEDGLSGDMREYIVISNGVALSKIKHGSSANVTLGQIPLEKTETLMSSVRQRRDSLAGGGIACKGCELYHLFYGDAAGTNALSVRSADAPGWLPEIEVETAAASRGTELAQQFFVHFIYSESGEDAVDYHIFSDGTVLREEFGDANGDLLASTITKIGQADIADLASMVDDSFFSSISSLKGCQPIGLDYGYLEIHKSYQYGLIYTCGTESSKADAIFNHLMTKTGAR
jgi:hypothetical protein